MSLEEAAYGAHEIAASNMIRAIKAVSTERGRDPREFALFAFGGNGPLFACGMAAALGIGRVIVPPAPGLFSSFGLLYADVEHHYSRTFRRLLRQADLAEIERAWGELARQATAQLADEGFTGDDAPGCAARRRCTTRGRASSSWCPCPTARSTPPWSRIWRRPSAREHEKTYGHRAGAEEPVELVSIQVVGQGAARGRRRARAHRVEPRPSPSRVRRAGSISAASTAGSRRRSCAAPTLPSAAPARSSSRSTMPPAWCRPEPPPSWTGPAASSSRSMPDGDRLQCQRRGRTPRSRPSTGRARGVPPSFMSKREKCCRPD